MDGNVQRGEREVSARRARELRRSARRRGLPKVVTWVALLGLGLFAMHCGLYASASTDVSMHGEGATRKLLQDATVLENTTDGGGGDSLYPPDLFTRKELKAGGPIVLYAGGVLYMFVFLAIVCDEFFVPALEVIIEKFDISDDVAGATLMAAGGSAPELFTSLIGVFFAKSGSVGFGTIIGSAVFNVLFVIGMCAIFSLDVLELTWWPLARDCTWYTIDLVILYLCFRDKKIELWESALMLILYLCYVGFMKFNSPAERFVKGLLGQKIVPAGESKSASTEPEVEPVTAKPAVPMENPDQSPPRRRRSSEFDGGGVAMISPGSALAMHEVKDAMGMSMSHMLMRMDSVKNLEVVEDESFPLEGRKKVQRKSVSEAATNLEALQEEEEAKQEEEDEGLDLSWPEGLQNQVVFVLCAPILYSLAYTVPDVRREGMANYWALSFLLSILWIGASSYLMVWWATVVGDVIGMPDEVMGYTFLAAGTSVPDLMSSVIVAKQGLGDMAVSSSIGSNIFDITFGLPLPWFFWILANGEAYVVESKSLTFSLVLLIIMLLAVVFSIAGAGWKMSKALGGVMFLLYGVFLALVLLKSGGNLGALNDV